MSRLSTDGSALFEKLDESCVYKPKIPHSIAAQTTWTDHVIDVVQQVPYGLGQAVHYWEPAWLNNTSLESDCNDAILFTPDYSNWLETVGYSRSSADLFKVRTYGNVD